MKLSYLKTHWSPEEAHNMVVLLDDLREAIWNNYHDEIIEFCRVQHRQEHDIGIETEDDKIPF